MINYPEGSQDGQLATHTCRTDFSSTRGNVCISFPAMFGNFLSSSCWEGLRPEEIINEASLTRGYHFRNQIMTLTLGSLERCRVGSGIISRWWSVDERMMRDSETKTAMVEAVRPLTVPGRPWQLSSHASYCTP